MTKNSISMKEIQKEWGFIPSIRGKQARMNIHIMRILCLKGPASTWELAKSYLETRGSWEAWGPDRQYHERQKLNSTIYKRLRNLRKMRYVEKTDSQYRITFKGCFLMVLIDPSIASSVPANRKVSAQDPVFRAIKQIIPEITPANFSGHFAGVKEVVKDSMASKTLSFLLKTVLQTYKINLDAINDKDLLKMLKMFVDKHKSQE